MAKGKLQIANCKTRWEEGKIELPEEKRGEGKGRGHARKGQGQIAKTHGKRAEGRGKKDGRKEQIGAQVMRSEARDGGRNTRGKRWDGQSQGDANENHKAMGN